MAGLLNPLFETDKDSPMKPFRLCFLAPHGGRRRRCHGFTLIETMIVVAVVGILSSVALPSFEGYLQRARRLDALVSLMQAQLAQERYRADHRRYGSLADLGLRSSSASGHYTLSVALANTDGYELVASAIGLQMRDAACRSMRIDGSGANLVFASGPDASASNANAINRKCWNL